MTVENARRHGHADPRFAARPRLRLIMGGDAPTTDGVEQVVHEPRGLTLTEAHDDVSAWENEGGRYATADVKAGKLRSALDWLAFREWFFPDRLLHDFEAVRAYAAYRAAGLVRPVSAAIP